MRTTRNLFVFGLLAVVCSLQAAAEFRAGAALRVVTPDPLLPVSGGVGRPSPVDRKMGDLFARVLVVEKDGARVALVCLDFLGWPKVLGDRVRTKVPGIPAENIIIGVTHTHSAPDSYGFPDREGNHGADLDYLDWVCGQTAEAINEALGKLQPAHLKVAVGKAADGIAWNAYAEALYDPRCGVVQAVAAGGGATIATLVNFANHPEVLGADKGILSPDWCGPFYDRIEAKAGGMALYFNGAQGGMVTADNRVGDGEHRDWEQCVRIGELLADESLRIIADAEKQADPQLVCGAKAVSFPVESEILKAVLTHSPLGYRADDDNQVTTQVNVVNLGTAQMVTIPGEALPNIGAYLKRKMPGDHDFLLGLTNDGFGYILVKEDYFAFDRYNYISRTSLGERTGEIFTNAALDLVARVPAPDGASRDK